MSIKVLKEMLLIELKQTFHRAHLLALNAVKEVTFCKICVNIMSRFCNTNNSYQRNFLTAFNANNCKIKKMAISYRRIKKVETTIFPGYMVCS